MSKSYPQLRRIFDEYERIAGDSLEKSIKLEFTGSVQKGYLAVGKEFYFLRIYTEKFCSWRITEYFGGYEVDFTEIYSKIIRTVST